MRNHQYKKLIKIWTRRLKEDFHTSTASESFQRIIPYIRHHLLISHENGQAIIHPPRDILRSHLALCVSVMGA